MNYYRQKNIKIFNSVFQVVGLCGNNDNTRTLVEQSPGVGGNMLDVLNNDWEEATPARARWQDITLVEPLPMPQIEVIL